MHCPQVMRGAAIMFSREGGAEQNLPRSSGFNALQRLLWDASSFSSSPFSPSFPKSTFFSRVKLISVTPQSANFGDCSSLPAYLPSPAAPPTIEEYHVARKLPVLKSKHSISPPDLLIKIHQDFI